MIEKIFKEKRACWIHSGDPAEPHVELSSGLCSNAYFNCSRVLCDPILVEELARLLGNKLKQAGIEDSFPDWVVWLCLWSDHFFLRSGETIRDRTCFC